MQEVSCVVVVAVWLNSCAVVVPLFVDFWWASGGQSKNGRP